jgi:hypothetical protein
MKKIYTVGTVLIKANHLKYLLPLLALGNFISCSLDDNSFNNKVISRDVIADIDTFTIWDKSNEYVIQKTGFTVKDTLIIQAGTIVKFNPDSSCSIIVADSGVIVAQGSTDTHVIFTSMNDARHVLNNTPLNNTKSAATGDWNSIILNSVKKSIFNFCEFYYGGGGEEKSTIKIGVESSAMVMNSIFAYNDGGNLETGNGVVDASQAAKNTLIRFNEFYNNNLPITVSTSLNIDSSNTFHNQGNISEINKYNCILVKTSLPVGSTLNWLEQEVAFVISGPDFVISPAASVLFGDNVTIKFLKNSVMTVEGANSTLRNYEGPGVVFTSIYDDNYKGDSNGDNNAAHPQPGDWSICIKDTLTFEYQHVFYASKTNCPEK